MALWGKKPEQSSAEGSPGVNSGRQQGEASVALKPDFKNLFDRKSEMSAQAAIERYGKVRSALDSGTVIQGKLTFDTPVRIDGKLTGEIFSSSALIIGDSGAVDAAVEVASLVVLGSIKGTIKVTERIEVYSGGVVQGSITTPVLVLEQGCSLNGECRMPQPETLKSSSGEEKGGTPEEDWLGWKPGSAKPAKQKQSSSNQHSDRQANQPGGQPGGKEIQGKF